MSAAQVTMPERRRFTVEEYHRMAEVGLLRPDERVELIDGEIIRMSPIGSRHGAVVARLDRHFQKLGGQAFVWVQNSVRVDKYGEPQPDLGLLKPRHDDYENAHPAPDDIFLLVEVGDSSLLFDMNTKRRYYASHNIREFWVVDAVNKIIHVYRDLRDGEYQGVSQASGEQTLAPQAFPDFVAAARQMIG